MTTAVTVLLLWAEPCAGIRADFPKQLVESSRLDASKLTQGSYLIPLGVYNPAGLRTWSGQEFITCVRART